MIEFFCEGCGDHVTDLGREAIPKHGLCAVCAWLCEYVPPAQMMELRKGMGLLNLERKPR